MNADQGGDEPGHAVESCSFASPVLEGAIDAVVAGSRPARELFTDPQAEPRSVLVRRHLREQT